jgi:DHA1 family inner membrane transport protein
MPLPLVALFVAAFGIGTTEFVIMGLLPEVAGDLGVDIPAAGLLITGYALGVVVGGPILALATGRLARKTALLVLMGVFLIGNFLCAVAPSYGLLMAARIVAGFCHGAFFGIGAVVASDLVPAGKRASAVAAMFAGLTVANILGVPGGTAFGQAFGWRSSFLVVVAIGLAATAAIVILVPRQARPEGGRLFSELRVLAKGQVLLGMAMSGLMSASLFAVYTYIAPILREVTGIGASATTWVLLVFGVGTTVGVLTGGRLADWKLMPSVIGIFAALILIFVVFHFTSVAVVPAVITILVWGAINFASGAPLQVKVVNAAIEAPNLASTLNQSAFNLGNAIGAWLGAEALQAGVGYQDLPWLGACLAGLALATALVSAATERRPPARVLARAS